MWDMRDRLWDSQPQEPVGINKSSTLARGLVVAVPGSIPYDAVRGAALTVTGVLDQAEANRYGRMRQGAASAYIDLGSGFDPGTGGATCLCVLTVAGGTNTFPWSSKSASSANGWELLRNAIAGQIQLRAYDSSTSYVLTVLTGLQNGPHVVIARFTPSGLLEIFCDSNYGSPDTYQSLTGPASIASSQNLRIHSRGTTYYTGKTGDFLYWNRPISDAEVYSALLGNWHEVWEPRRVWIPAAASAGATNLVIADATHAHAADNLALTLDTYLAVQDAAHAHAADNLALTLDTYLVIAEALHSHSADNLDLTSDTALVIAEALHAHTAENLTLLAGDTLSIADGAHGHAADSVTLTLDTWLAISDALHAHGADNLAFTLDTFLAIADALHGHAADNVTLDFAAAAAVLGSLSGSTRKTGPARSSATSSATRSNRQTARR